MIDYITRGPLSVGSSPRRLLLNYYRIAAAENLGLPQAAQRESGGGSSFLGAFALGHRDRRHSCLENEPDDRWLAGQIGVAAGNGYSNCLRSRNLLLSEKSPFINGLLGIGA